MMNTLGLYHRFICSFSTSDGIIKIFDKANKYQETSSKQFPVISVVLIDDGK